jgi:hypothetical protein
MTSEKARLKRQARQFFRGQVTEYYRELAGDAAEGLSTPTAGSAATAQPTSGEEEGPEASAGAHHGRRQPSRDKTYRWNYARCTLILLSCPHPQQHG